MVGKRQSLCPANWLALAVFMASTQFMGVPVLLHLEPSQLAPSAQCFHINPVRGFVTVPSWLSVNLVKKGHAGALAELVATFAVCACAMEKTALHATKHNRKYAPLFARELLDFLSIFLMSRIVDLLLSMPIAELQSIQKEFEKSAQLMKLSVEAVVSFNNM